MRKIFLSFLIIPIFTLFSFIFAGHAMAFPIQIDVFTRDINGNMVLDVPVDFDTASPNPDPVSGTSSYCYKSNCHLPACDPNNPGAYAAAFRQDAYPNPANMHWIWDVSPGGPGGAFRTVDPNVVSSSDPRWLGTVAARDKGAWATIRTGWGFDFNCSCSPLKETLDLTEPAFSNYQVDHMEGDIYAVLSGGARVKYTCPDATRCYCSDTPGNCAMNAPGLNSCMLGSSSADIRNTEGCSFHKDSSSNKYWSYAYAVNGMVTSTEFVLSQKPPTCSLDVTPGSVEQGISTDISWTTTGVDPNSVALTKDAPSTSCPPPGPCVADVSQNPVNPNDHTLFSSSILGTWNFKLNATGLDGTPVTCGPKPLTVTQSSLLFTCDVSPKSVTVGDPIWIEWGFSDPSKVDTVQLKRCFYPASTDIPGSTISLDSKTSPLKFSLVKPTTYVITARRKSDGVTIKCPSGADVNPCNIATPPPLGFLSPPSSINTLYDKKNWGSLSSPAP